MTLYLLEYGPHILLILEQDPDKKDKLRYKDNEKTITMTKYIYEKNAVLYEEEDHYLMKEDTFLRLMKGGNAKMEIEEFIKQKGMFLRAIDVIDNPKAAFKILDEGEFVENQKFGGTEFHLNGEFNGEDKVWNCNKTNGRIISEKTGSTDSKKWIGKYIVLETYKTRTSDGKMVDAINVKDVLDAPPAQ